MKRKLGKTIASGLALASVICVTASANAATYYAGTVGTCWVTPTKTVIIKPTIQAAVTAAETAGATIVKVCPGTYPEEVVINQRLTLQGINVGGFGQAVIAATGGLTANAASLTSGNPIAAQIYVHDTTGVNISNVVVDGTGNGLSGCSYLMGIYYQNASGTVNNVVTRNQVISGCGTGLGIFVQSGVGVLPANHTIVTSNVTVENSSVHDFEKNGITGNETGTTLTAISNRLRGNLPTNVPGGTIGTAQKMAFSLAMALPGEPRAIR